MQLVQQYDLINRKFVRKNALATIGVFMTLTFGTAIADQLPKLDIQIGKQLYRVELAATPSERRKGLMNRSSLPPNGGMLLIYPNARDHRVWMKNMKISLKVYWIDESFRVVHMQSMQPCANAPCPAFGAGQKTRFILELKNRQHTIGVGDLVVGIDDL